MMPGRKRAPAGPTEEPVPKRRSLRQAAKTEKPDGDPVREPRARPRVSAKSALAEKAPEKPANKQPKAPAGKAKSKKQPPPPPPPPAQHSSGQAKKPTAKTASDVSTSRAVSEDPDPSSLPTKNDGAPRHDGEWYWLMKAEPESRLENGIDVKFSIDDLRAKDKPEGWDGIRNYASRNNMRNMNAGDKAFFYHSSCKEPGIVGVMEIVNEFSEDKSARRPGTPYYDASSTKEKPRWDLVHVAFRKKFAVQIGLKELRELGKPGGPLEKMQMLKQTRLSVSRVSAEEWKVLCEVADQKAAEVGLEHEV